MTSPSWEDLKSTLEVGSNVTGTVTKHESYGVLVDIGYDYDGLIQITDFKDKGSMTPGEFPAIGDELEAVVLGFKEYGHQIWLGVRPSQL
jgi:ribosomal protein S1